MDTLFKYFNNPKHYADLIRSRNYKARAIGKFNKSLNVAKVPTPILLMPYPCTDAQSKRVRVVISSGTNPKNIKSVDQIYKSLLKLDATKWKILKFIPYEKGLEFSDAGVTNEAFRFVAELGGDRVGIYMYVDTDVFKSAPTSETKKIKSEAKISGTDTSIAPNTKSEPSKSEPSKSVLPVENMSGTERRQLIQSFIVSHIGEYSALYEIDVVLKFVSFKSNPLPIDSEPLKNMRNYVLQHRKTWKIIVKKCKKCDSVASNCLFKTPNLCVYC
jgi:MoaA/NifB/PqqE/SkfB family radical SAM enzyme